MTETGSTVERLRYLVERNSDWVPESGYGMPIVIPLPHARALLAVVEAAQDADELLADVYAAPPFVDRVTKVRVRLSAALDRLHSQASDEAPARQPEEKA